MFISKLLGATMVAGAAEPQRTTAATPKTTGASARCAQTEPTAAVHDARSGRGTRALICVQIPRPG
jgi:hypothetical protein